MGLALHGEQPMSTASDRRDSDGSGYGEVVAGPWPSAEAEAPDPALELPPEHRLPQGALASIARALQNILERFSGVVMRRVVGTADEFGVDGIYVALILMRERDMWPVLRSEDRHALDVAGRLMSGFAMLPSTNYMQVPPAEAEVLVDRILSSIATWSRTRLMPDLKREYMALLEEYADRLGPMLEVRRTESAPSDLRSLRPAVALALLEAFERWLGSDASTPSRRAMLGILDNLFG
jgi:hypothetical protein